MIVNFLTKCFILLFQYHFPVYVLTHFCFNALKITIEAGDASHYESNSIKIMRLRTTPLQYALYFIFFTLELEKNFNLYLLFIVEMA
jgi:hypothetical protein